MHGETTKTCRCVWRCSYSEHLADGVNWHTLNDNISTYFFHIWHIINASLKDACDTWVCTGRECEPWEKLWNNIFCVIFNIFYMGWDVKNHFQISQTHTPRPFSQSNSVSINPPQLFQVSILSPLKAVFNTTFKSVQQFYYTKIPLTMWWRFTLIVPHYQNFAETWSLNQFLNQWEETFHSIIRQHNSSETLWAWCCQL